MGKKRTRRRPLAVRVLLWLIAAGIVFCAAVAGHILIQEKKVMTSVSASDPYDAIIVLGAQVLPSGVPNVQLSWRLDAALKAYGEKQTPIVVCGAQGRDEPTTEAEAMKRYLVERGVPEKDVLMDPASFNTRQNLENAGKLLKDRPEIRRLLIVTSDYHVPRSLAIARDLGFDAIGLGSPCKPDYWLKNHARETLAWIKYLGIKYLHLPLE